METNMSREDFKMHDYRTVLRAEAENSRTLVSLATKMRITQQATVDVRTVKPPVKKRPWDD
jgi:hypothetical protein